MATLKKQTFGSICTLLALVLTVVGIIAYYLNIGGAGYFQNAAVPLASTLMLVTAVALLAVVVLAQLNLGKVGDKVAEILSGALQIAIPAGLLSSAMLLVENRAQGIAFIYFSNEEVLQEVQTAANLSSATCAIVTIVLLVVAAVVGIVAAFSKQKKTA